MGQPTDVRGLPGELVILRTKTYTVSDTPGTPPSSSAGRARGGNLGLILSVAVPGWTYVLWSGIPTVMGWLPDGTIRRLNQRG